MSSLESGFRVYGLEYTGKRALPNVNFKSASQPETMRPYGNPEASKPKPEGGGGGAGAGAGAGAGQRG